MFRKIICKILYPFVRIFLNMKVNGKENIPSGIPFIMTANHRSNLDVVVIYLCFDLPFNFMAKKELFTFKPFGFLLSKLGAFPVNRNGNDIAAVKKSISALKKGEVLGIFPEGTRHESMEIDSAKAGAVMLASKCKVPIVPVAISGKYKFFSKISINVGAPVYIESKRKLENEDYKQYTNQLINIINALSEEK